MPSPSLLNKFSPPFPLPIRAFGISTTVSGGGNSLFVRFQLSTLQNFTGKPLAAAAVFPGNPSFDSDRPNAVLDSLRVLQWDELCDCVASFAGTSLGKQATKVSANNRLYYEKELVYVCTSIGLIE